MDLLVVAIQGDSGQLRTHIHTHTKKKVGEGEGKKERQEKMRENICVTCQNHGMSSIVQNTPLFQVITIRLLACPQAHMCNGHVYKEDACLLEGEHTGRFAFMWQHF